MVLASLLGTGAAPAAAASQTLVPACDGINLRTAATTSSTLKVRLGFGHLVTVSGVVSGGSWGTSCPTWKSAGTWYTVTHVDGQTVASRYGVSILYAATGILTAAPAGSSPTPGPTATPAPTPTATPTAAPIATPTAAPTPTPATAAGGTPAVPACSGVNLRMSTSTRTTIVTRLAPGDRVVVDGTVAGSAWGTSCPGWKSGSRWYRVVAVNGRSVASRFGVASIYAATGVLNLVPAPATPAPSPSSTAAPTAPPTPTPSLPPTPSPSPSPSPTPAPTSAPTPSPSPSPTPVVDAGRIDLVPACDGINLRAGTSTATTRVVRLGINSTVTVDSTVSGSAWSTSCPTWKTGSTWYRVTGVNGVPVSQLYGLAAIYAATGILDYRVSAGTPGLTVLDPATTFYGRGYGHGVGLSQYGARGRALAGQSASEILAHYFVGTTIGAIDSATPIRVLLLDNAAPTATAPLVLYGRGGDWTISGIDATFPSDARLRVLPSADGSAAIGRLVVDSAAGQVLYDGPGVSDLRVQPTSDATTLQLYSKPSTYDLFRGALRLLATGSTLDVINELPLEQYLRGVVPAEMPSYWPAAAVTAQAIAARSYAAYRLRPGSGTFDVYDDTRSQVYGGVRREQSATDAIIAATAGQVLRSGSSIANALFHSTGGGATENNENVFVSSTGARVAGVVSYLRGSMDRDPTGVPYDAAAPYATWQTGAYTIAQLSAIFGADSRTAVGTLEALDLRNRGVSGRLVSVTLVGSAGVRTVSGDVFVAVFNANRPSGAAPLRSTLLDAAPIP
jgi:stage II sporulation protein D